MRGVIAILLLAASTAAAEPAKRCDAAKLEQQGTRAWNEGMPERALASFEASARCKPSDSVHFLAAMAACKLFQQTKRDSYLTTAKRYRAKLPAAKQARLVQFCVRGCGGAEGPAHDDD